MQIKRTISLAAATMICNLTALGYDFQHRSSIMIERSYYNPAASPLENGDHIRLFGVYNMGLPSYVGKQVFDTSVEYYHTAQKYACAATLSQAAYSYYSSHSISASYSHSFALGTKGNQTLRIGGRMTLGFNNVDFSKLSYGQSGTKLILSPDMDLGLEYTWKNLTVGASVRNAVSKGIKYEGIEYINLPRAYYFYGLYNVVIDSDKLTITPHIMLGSDQKTYIAAGVDFRILRNYRIGYIMRAVDMSHSFEAGARIGSRVDLNAGYTLLPSHKYSYAFMSVTIKLTK